MGQVHTSVRHSTLTCKPRPTAMHTACTGAHHAHHSQLAGLLAGALPSHTGSHARTLGGALVAGVSQRQAADGGVVQTNSFIHDLSIHSLPDRCGVLA